MKSVCCTLAFSVFASTAFAGQLGTYDLGFRAPTINNKVNDTNPSAGSIILDTSDDTFYGRTTSNGWVPFAGAAVAVPAGTLLPFAGATAPTGYRLANGGSVDQADCPELFDLIGTSYGPGTNPPNSFSLPDTRGLFVRGAGSQALNGVTYSGTAGAKQADQMQAFQVGGTLNGTTYYGAAVAQNQGPVNQAASNHAVVNYNSTIQGVASRLQPISDGVNGSPRTGAETRPANISLNYIIKCN